MTPWTVVLQAPLSMGFSRQGYWSELLFPSPGDLPNPGIGPTSLTFPALVGRFFTTKDFPGGSDCKAPAYNVGDPGSIHGMDRQPPPFGKPLHLGLLKSLKHIFLK